jgi:hypothetical protein
MTAVDRQMFALTLGNKSTRDRNRGTRNGRERERDALVASDIGQRGFVLRGRTRPTSGRSHVALLSDPPAPRLIVSPHVLSRCFLLLPLPFLATLPVVLTR